MTKTYMLWQMPDPPAKTKDKSLEDHIRAAAAYFKEKYGVPATECFVNPTVLRERMPTPDDQEIAVDGIKVMTKRTVLKKCLHIGF